MKNKELSALADEIEKGLFQEQQELKPKNEDARVIPFNPQMDVLVTKLEQAVVCAREMFRTVESERYEAFMKETAENVYGITLAPYMEQGLCLTLPVLIANKRKQSIIREPLIAVLSDVALKEKTKQRIKLPMQDAIIIFVHRFSTDDSVNFRVRDYDNYDVQDILNALVYEGYLKSDSGTCLDGMDITKTGCDSTGTTAYIIPKAEFPKWIKDNY